MSAKDLFQNFKPAFLSKGVLGGGLGVIMGGMQIGGYAITPADIAEANQLLNGVVTGLAGLLAIWGRVTARKRVKLFG